MDRKMTIVLLGAGNLATALGCRIESVGLSISQIYSRTESSASQLGRRLSSCYTTSTDSILKGADLYIVALSDSAHQEVLPSIEVGDGLLVHTAGSVPMESLSDYAARYGVLYPLQTFTKGREVDFETIPIFVEGSSEQESDILVDIARVISPKVTVINSKQRAQLHLAAIFSCNFVNYMYSVAEDILESEELTFDLIQPLIEETASKIKEFSPSMAQTGPAVRFNREIINKHIDDLNGDKRLQDLYEQISSAIFQKHSKSIE